jgi:hexosaminidase
MKEFSYRGFMLDSARHFIPVEDLRKLMVAARICGMNRMHWHLTDDQGWRLEIRKYPQLTEIGAFRGKSFFGDVSRTENNCGFYTQEDVRNVVRFAAENGMEVIPEIEIPGHASALLAACPEAGCRRTAYGPAGEEKAGEPWQYAVKISGGIFPNLLCAGKPEAIRLMEDILDEVIELFPSKMIHIGGDEALKIHWRRCPDCQARMRREGLKSEDELQRALVLEIGAYLAEKGRETIVWNDVLSGGTLPPHFIVQQWTAGEEATRAFLAGGGRVINSDTRVMYFDYPYGRIDVKKIWRSPRIPDWAKGYEDQLLGMECPLWTERVTNLERASFLLFPRLAAAGLKAIGGGELPWEAFRAEVRNIEDRIEETGLQGAPEAYWDMAEEAAKADVQAEHDRIFSPEALPYEMKERKIVKLDRAERLMEEAGIPKPVALRAGDTVL